MPAKKAVPKQAKPDPRFHPYRRGGKINKSGLTRAIKADGYDTKASFSFQGYHSKVISVSDPRTYTNKGGRFLTHLATVLKEWYTSTGASPEYEIQIALFDNRKYIIASNGNETAIKIYRELVATTAAAFLRTAATTVQARGEASNAREAYRLERHARKLTKELAGTRRGGEVMAASLTGVAADASTFEHEGRDLAIITNANADIGRRFSDFLSDPVKSVAIVTSGSLEAHAEQKILLALCKAAVIDRSIVAKPIVFAGTFRPCRGCYESLNLVKGFVFDNLQFGDRPGHLWATTEDAHASIADVCHPFVAAKQSLQFDKGGHIIGLEKQSYHTNMRTRKGGKRKTWREIEGYDTDSESDTD